MCQQNYTMQYSKQNTIDYNTPKKQFIWLLIDTNTALNGTFICIMIKSRLIRKGVVCFNLMGVASTLVRLYCNYLEFGLTPDDIIIYLVNKYFLSLNTFPK